MSSSLGYSFIDDKNENKKPVVKPKRNITIKKKKNFLNGIQKILSRSDDSDDLDDFKPLNKKEDVEEVGGISVYSDSIHLGVQNPASIADLDLINYAVGISHKETTQKTVSQNQQQSTTSFDYFAVAIPMGKLVSSFKWF